MNITEKRVTGHDVEKQRTHVLGVDSVLVDLTEWENVRNLSREQAYE